ncbi:hypothetical protein C8F04DRAFT_1400064 [Mycena alexandri]|uniref:F-box domain-containing protein n=1 Tax=Mycena alexandri TaxID=1745969 RepID=A0AAD6WTB3_9AGAR|nr:hypothetical protein C8F04DRAFT_1400064 [Mycena alexandri]
MADSLTTARLPPELCSCIFGLAVLEQSITNFKTLLRRLCDVCGTCSDWRNITISTPALWCRLRVECKTPLVAIHTFLSRSQSLPLLFELFFIGDKASAASVADRLASITPHIPRIQHFNLRTNIPEALAAVHDIFHMADSPLLRNLSIGFIFSPHGEFSPADIHPLICRTWFEGKYGMLEHLSLSCAYMPFDRLFFPSLRTLFILDVPFRHSRSASSTASAIANSPQLLQLKIGGFPCHAMNVVTEPIRSASVNALDIAFSKDGTTAALASCLDFPSLSFLRIDLARESDVQSALTCVRLFRRVRRLVIVASSNNIFSPDALFLTPAFPGVVSIDLGGSYPSFFVNLLLVSNASAINGYSTSPLVTTLS